MASRTWLCLSAVVLVGCSNIDADVDSRDQQLGLLCAGLGEVLPSPQTVGATSCEDGRTVFGPARFEAGHKQTASFETSGSGDVCVTIVASGSGGHDSGDTHGKKLKGHKNGHGNSGSHSNSGHKASAKVYLDGDKIAKPKDFHDDGVEQQEIALDAGAHELRVKVSGSHDASVEIEVREAFAELNTGLDIVNGDGSLRLTNVATDHPLITPNGDLHHDATFFNAEVEPLNVLPGKDDGSVDYFLNWEFSIVALPSGVPEGDPAICTTVKTITGQTQVNSPTRVLTADWDGTDSSFVPLPSGNYAYVFSVTLVDEFGASFGSIASPPYGIVVDSAPANYAEQLANDGLCDFASSTDPLDTNCLCPGGGGVPGLGDPTCSFGTVQHLLPEGGFFPGNRPNYYNPAIIDRSFITTTQNPATGRYQVEVDLRTYSGGGLVSKGDGVWGSESQLRQWVADMTGVPTSTGDSIFNFDFVQLGTSTGVTMDVAATEIGGTTGFANHSFNNFFLDAITDDDGFITIGAQTTDLAAMYNDDQMAPSQYAIDGRANNECSTSANTDGSHTLGASFCAYNTAVVLGDASDFGVYSLRTSLFGIEFDGVVPTQDEVCVINGIYSCGVRTIRVPADSLQVEATYYAEEGGVAQVTRTEFVEHSAITALSVSADRGEGDDGVCSRGVATLGGLAVRLDSADGAVPSTCVINGVIPY